MRDAAKVQGVSGRFHAGLAYQALAPTDDTGKVPNSDSIKSKYFDRISRSKPHRDYKLTYDAWYEATHSLGWTAYVETSSPLLIGTGQPSAVEVGLTIHPIWGVPYIPGSALKGLLAHYIMATYGPEKLGVHPDSEDHPEPDRAPFQGVTWSGSKIKHGPGDVYKALFGSPTADSDSDYKDKGAGAAVGQVTFHDALMRPLVGDVDGPFVQDVVNPHVNSYYQKGEWPNDRDNPVPIFFLAVRPRLEFTLAISGAPELQEMALDLLLEALAEWGVGAKTRAGYGRFSLQRKISPPVNDPILDELESLFMSDLTQNERLDQFESLFVDRLSDHYRQGVTDVVDKALQLCRKHLGSNKKRKERIKRLTATITGG